MSKEEISKEDHSTYHGIACKVKWFNQFKGYGFVEAKDIVGDIFLHFSVLDESGIKKLNNDDIIKCDVETFDKGTKVVKVYEILQQNKYEVGDNKKPETVEATMKWFNPAKGFGFATLPSGDDVFIHTSLLRKHKMETIEHGQVLKLLVRYTNFGYEALDILA